MPRFGLTGCVQLGLQPRDGLLSGNARTGALRFLNRGDAAVHEPGLVFALPHDAAHSAFDELGERFAFLQNAFKLLTEIRRHADGWEGCGFHGQNALQTQCISQPMRLARRQHIEGG